MPSDFQKPQVGNKTTLIQEKVLLETQQYPFFIPEFTTSPEHLAIIYKLIVQDNLLILPSSIQGSPYWVPKQLF